VQLRKPGATLVDQLDLPRDQGMVVEEVGPNSPAGKAGLKAHDILLELDGKAVSSKPADFGKMLEGIQSDKAINAVVMRKGKKEAIKGLKLARASAAGPANLGGFPNLPRFGNGLVLPNLAGKSITLSRSNDQFTATQRDGNVTITVKGKIDQGKAQASEITIQDGGQSKTYDSLTKVPAAHQEAVKNLIQMSQRGRARIDQ
jgi:S1-C subfamily serine protease